MNFDCIWANFWNEIDEIDERISEAFFNVLDIDFDENIEKRKDFDETIDRETIFAQNIDFFDVAVDVNILFLLINFIFSATIIFFRTMIAKMFIFSNLNLLFSKT